MNLKQLAHIRVGPKSILTNMIWCDTLRAVVAFSPHVERKTVATVALKTGTVTLPNPCAVRRMRADELDALRKKVFRDDDHR
jgi:hypothetical protein